MAAVPSDEAVAWPEDAVEVGRIVDAWGLQGGIKVKPFSSDPQALFSSRRWFLQPPQGRPSPRGAAAVPTLLRIASARSQGELVVASVRELPDRTAAEALQGCRVFVPRASFPSLETDEYYWLDLIGLAVVNREGESLGTVAGLLDTGAHSVLRVTPTEEAVGSAGQERLIPFVAAYIDGVELAERRINVDWGLDY